MRFLFISDLGLLLAHIAGFIVPAIALQEGLGYYDKKWNDHFQDRFGDDGGQGIPPGRLLQGGQGNPQQGGGNQA